MTTKWMQNLKINEPQFSEDLHGSITPAEIRAGEPVRAKVIAALFGKQISKPVRVWRLSPLGIEIVLDQELDQLEVGTPVDLEIAIGPTISKLNGVIATTKQKERNLSLLGIRFFSKEVDSWGGNERRAVQRWSCSSDFVPTGVAANPGKYNDFIIFKVLNFSSTGMQVSTSLRNKYLVPGMRLECSISLPLVGHIKCEFEIANSAIRSENGKETLSVGGKFLKPSDHTIEAISQYVFQFGPVASLKDLRDSGLRAKQSSTAIDYRYVRTKEEYQQVLELRKRAYSEAGKLTDEDAVADIYDTRSRIIIGVYKGQVIASMRLIFNEISDKMEHEEFVSFGEDFPRRDEICEITRVCTHPDFRGSDVLMSLFRQVAITVGQSGRKYILGCATAELLPLYLKLGFKATDIKYSHASLNNIEHTVFMGDVAAGLAGVGVNPIVWNVVWSDVAKYLADSQNLALGHFDQIRVGFYRMLRPLSYWLYQKSRKPRTRKGIQNIEQPRKQQLKAS